MLREEDDSRSSRSVRDGFTAVVTDACRICDEGCCVRMGSLDDKPRRATRPTSRNDMMRLRRVRRVVFDCYVNVKDKKCSITCEV